MTNVTSAGAQAGGVEVNQTDTSETTNPETAVSTANEQAVQDAPASEPTATPVPDQDGDAIADDLDNCIDLANPDHPNPEYRS